MKTNASELSVAEYARRRKCSHQAILKAITAGKIRTHAGRIDAEQADKALDAGALTYSAALARRTAAQAQREELRLLKEQNQLVSIETVRRAQEAINAVIRARLLAIPGKLAMQLTGMSAPEVKAKLDQEIYEVLSELASRGRTSA